MNKLLLYFIVFICGGAVLAIEILGTRIVGPYYGVSIYLWSALISVTLIALSAGYMIGGRIADKKKNYNVLAFIIALAGIILILMPFFRNFVFEITEKLGLRTSVLISSLILFFPPLTLLGMVSPYAVKLRTQSLDVVGTSAGNLYSVSTIGSVVAALLTGYFLIPNFGVIKLTISIGIVLIITSLIILLTDKKRSVKIISLPFFILLILTPLSLISSEKEDSAKGLITLRQSEYGEIRVLDLDDNRYLLIDGSIHSAIDKNTKETILPYTWVIDITKKLENYSGDMLLIGLGGGSVLKSFYDDNWDVDVVEIDPVISEVEKRYFNLVSGFDNIHILDGREYLKTTGKTYDLIVLDAFGSGSVPFHLATVESFGLAKSRLNKNGIITVNLEAVGWNDIIVTSIAKTLRQVFGNVLALPIAEPPDQLGNVIIIASDKPFEMKEELERDYWNPDYRFSADYERNHAWDNRFIPDMKNAIILSDDLNPVEIWSERINLLSRRKLHNLLGKESFLW
ncbi:MAG TPA: fused MFS/spermidine synthase [Ignavibacteriaceae bacterium]|nr:fused MFS/spermidine synthase [Ignavibacteriaceae bacterium]